MLEIMSANCIVTVCACDRCTRVNGNQT